MSDELKTQQVQAIAQGKALFNQGLVKETIAYYEGILASTNDNEALLSDKAFKCRLQVDFARKLLEIELFEKAQVTLEQAESDLGEIDRQNEKQTVAFWKVRYALGKLQFRSLYQQKALETFQALVEFCNQL